MKEFKLHDIIISRSDLIEKGLVFISREVPIGSFRCDLLFKDRNGNLLYVEVKLKVDDRAVGQLLRYDGLVNNPKARFMLAGLTFVRGLKEGLKKHGYEYKEIELESEFNPIIVKPTLTKGESKFGSIEEVMKSFNNINIEEVIRRLIEYILGLQGTYYYISDGIMFKRCGRKYKFLSISTIGNRLLFHVPVVRRDEVYNQFRDKINIYLPIDKRDKNQIDLKLSDVNSFEELIGLIVIAYEERE